VKVRAHQSQGFHRNKRLVMNFLAMRPS